MSDGRRIYWDSCVFIHYINSDPDKILVLESILSEISNNGKDKIITSVLSKVEVCWAASEKNSRALSAEEESRIDKLWEDPSIIEIVDFNDEIAIAARGLLRNSMVLQLDKLKSKDAIHLATAQWVGATEIQVYDSIWSRYQEELGITITEPHVDQLRLPHT